MRNPTVGEFRISLRTMTLPELSELAVRMQTKAALLLEELVVLQEHLDWRKKAMDAPTLFGTPRDHVGMPMN